MNRRPPCPRTLIPARSSSRPLWKAFDQTESVAHWIRGFSSAQFGCLLGAACAVALATGSLAGAGDIDSSWRQARDRAIVRAIDPTDYECAPTQFEHWILEKIERIGLRDFLTLYDSGALDWPTYRSLLLDHDAAGQYIGVNGEYTRELQKRHRDNKRFWDVPTTDVLLCGMHGNVIRNEDQMIPTVKLYFLLERGLRLTDTEARLRVRRVQQLIEGNSHIGYDNPLFTLNAFAFTTFGQDMLGDGTFIPDKIVMGDGLLRFFEEIGFGDNAPDYIHAHEFAHHVQFELGVFNNVDGSPEATRRTELMADGFGAYFCAHARGATFRTKRFVEVMTSAHLIGDCGFEDPGHHGTPAQRERATVWGSESARTGPARGHISSAAALVDRFDAFLPILVAPDRL